MVRFLEDTNTQNFLTKEERESQYHEYLDNHINGVKRTWKEILSPLFKRASSRQFDRINKAIDSHDQSKYDPIEWNAYLDEFYPENPEGSVTKDHINAYNQAWRHHQLVNCHHWQHWVLIRDEGDLEPLDMPLEYVIEMLCDWQSFSLRDPESTAYKWWTENKDKMVMSDKTRELVEKYIVYLKEPLSKEI